MLKTEYELRGPADLTIAVVADLHEHDPASVLSILQSVRPDVIAVPGDLLERWKEGEKKDRSVFSLVISPALHAVDHFFRFGRKDDVSSEYAFAFLRAANRIAPVLYSFGNHELALTEEDMRVIAETGTVLLNSRSVRLKGICFGGIPSRQCTGEIDTAFLAKFGAEPGFKVLLCHHPEYYPQVSEYAGLILSGHCHGGQIRIRGRGLYGPGQGFFPKYDRGVYHGDAGEKRGTMVLSAGCANTASFPRFGNPEEVVIVRLKCDKEK